MADISRIHFWHYVLNEAGQPIQNAEIRLYLQDDPTTEANIYTSETSSTSTTTSNADIKTNGNGYFEFWIANQNETGGYARTQEFILEWFKAGIAPGYIYNYNPWPNIYTWEDENTGADKNYQNKFVSNYNVNRWIEHTNSIIPSASPHDIYPVDYESGCDNNRYNKVISNNLVYDILQGVSASDSFDLSTIYDSVEEHLETITSWNASGGIYYKDISHPSFVISSSVKMVDINTFEEVNPIKTIHISASATRISYGSDDDVYVTIQGSV